MRTLQVGDVVEVVFRNKLERPVNLVLAGGLIPDSPAHLAAPVLPGHTVRSLRGELVADNWQAQLGPLVWLGYVWDWWWHLT